MFGMVNVLGHSAELLYEKWLKSQGIKFDKADNDEHFDYTRKNDKKRVQVKRFETAGTTLEQLSVNLTKTHGNRSGSGTGSNYFPKNFDELAILDINGNFQQIPVKDIPRHKKKPRQLAGRMTIKRDLCVKPLQANFPTTNRLDPFRRDFLSTMKEKNEKFPIAMKKLKEKYGIKTYKKLWEKISRLTLQETDSLFTKENFRLITAAKGFAAEIHFNKLLKKKKIKFKQNTGMYDKADHIVKGKKVQVKTTYPNGTTKDKWALKTHKSHGHGEGELYSSNEFDIIAVFVGYEPQQSDVVKKIKENGGDKYTPTSVTNSFIFIPTSDLGEHPKHPGKLNRVSKVLKSEYKVNDLSVFMP